MRMEWWLWGGVAWDAGAVETGGGGDGRLAAMARRSSAREGGGVPAHLCFSLNHHVANCSRARRGLRAAVRLGEKRLASAAAASACLQGVWPRRGAEVRLRGKPRRGTTDERCEQGERARGRARAPTGQGSRDATHAVACSSETRRWGLRSRWLRRMS